MHIIWIYICCDIYTHITCLVLAMKCSNKPDFRVLTQPRFISSSTLFKGRVCFPLSLRDTRLASFHHLMTSPSPHELLRSTMAGDEITSAAGSHTSNYMLCP